MHRVEVVEVVWPKSFNMFIKFPSSARCRFPPTRFRDPLIDLFIQYKSTPVLGVRGWLDSVCIPRCRSVAGGSSRSRIGIAELRRVHLPASSRSRGSFFSSIRSRNPVRFSACGIAENDRQGRSHSFRDRRGWCIYRKGS